MTPGTRPGTPPALPSARELCPCWPACWFPVYLGRSALHVGQGLRHLPSPNPQQVNTADMPIRPGVEPPDDDPVTAPSISSTSKCAIGEPAKNARQASSTACRPTWRVPSGAGLVASNTQSSVIKSPRAPRSRRLSASWNLSMVSRALSSIRGDLPDSTGALDLTCEPLQIMSPRRRGRAFHHDDLHLPDQDHSPIPAASLARRHRPEGAPTSQGPQSLTSLLTVAQLRAVPATAAEVGPPALASTRRSSLRGYPSGVCR